MTNKNKKTVSEPSLAHDRPIPGRSGQQGNVTKKIDGRVNNGGARVGAGRKPVDHPKRPFGAKVSKRARDKVLRLSRKYKVSQARVLETAVDKLDLID